MTAPWVILAMGAGVYALRLAGLILPERAIPPAWNRALGFVPVALLTALVVASLGIQTDGDPRRLVAAAAGGLVAHGTRQMWACIVAGMLVHWLIGPA